MRQIIKFIAYLQIIGIILVVFGHSFHEYPDGDMGKNLLIYRMMYSFRMPLFMFVSGFLMVFTTRMRASSARPAIGRFVRQKLRRLLLPFAVLTIVTFIPRATMSGLADDHLDMDFNSFYHSLLYGDSLVIPYFWFLQASFLLLVISHTVITLGEKAGLDRVVLYLGIVIVAAALPYLPIEYTSFFAIDEAVRLGLFFALGCAYSRFHDKVDRFVAWTSPLFLPVAAIVWGTLFFITEGTPWGVLCSIAGIAMCISTARLMERHEVTMLDHLIGANYMIFLLSWYCNVASQQILHHLVELPWWCYTVLSLITGIYIPWLGYRYIQGHPDSRWVRVTALLLGQSFKK